MGTMMTEWDADLSNSFLFTAFLLNSAFVQIVTNCKLMFKGRHTFLVVHGNVNLRKLCVAPQQPYNNNLNLRLTVLPILYLQVLVNYWNGIRQWKYLFQL